MRRIALLLPPFALLAALLPAPEAAAQIRPGGVGRNAPLTGEPGSQQRAPPAALPGLQYRQAPAPIPAEPGQNLSPNAALFDAINRGDLAAAREAVGRGADIEARNVLGLTPVDAAVDQGRTEIMFFLLSVRAGSGARSAPLPEETIAAPPPPAASRAAARRRGTTSPPAMAPAMATEAAPAPLPQQAAMRPRLWAGDGGAPNPEIGFLGFDAGRPAGAAPPAPEAPAPATRRPRSGRG